MSGSVSDHAKYFDLKSFSAIVIIAALALIPAMPSAASPPAGHPASTPAIPQAAAAADSDRTLAAMSGRA